MTSLFFVIVSTDAFFLRYLDFPPFFKPDCDDYWKSPDPSCLPGNDRAKFAQPKTQRVENFWYWRPPYSTLSVCLLGENHFSSNILVTGPALENLLVVMTPIAPGRFWLCQPFSRGQRHRMWVMTVAALWNILRVMRHIAVRITLYFLIAALHLIIGSPSDDFLERSVTPQASVLWIRLGGQGPAQ